MKQKRYWLRGGIIGAIVYYGLSSVTIFIPTLFWTLSYINQIPLTLTQGLWKIFANTFFKDTSVMNFDAVMDIRNWFFRVAIILTGFILGALFGWIYGKIKNRNKTSQVV